MSNGFSKPPIIIGVSSNPINIVGVSMDRASGVNSPLVITIGVSNDLTKMAISNGARKVRAVGFTESKALVLANGVSKDL